MDNVKLVYELTIEPFNYSAVFGAMLGLAFIVIIEQMAVNAVTFVKGWRT